MFRFSTAGGENPKNNSSYLKGNESLFFSQIRATITPQQIWVAPNSMSQHGDRQGSYKSRHLQMHGWKR